MKDKKKQQEMSEQSSLIGRMIFDQNKRMLIIASLILILFKVSIVSNIHMLYSRYFIRSLILLLLSGFLFDYILYITSFSIYIVLPKYKKGEAVDMKIFTHSKMTNEQKKDLALYSIIKSLILGIFGFSLLTNAISTMLLFILTALIPYYIVFDKLNLIEAAERSIKNSTDYIDYYLYLIFKYIILTIIIWIVYYFSQKGSAVLLLFIPVIFYIIMKSTVEFFYIIIDFITGPAYLYNSIKSEKKGA